MRVLIVDDQPSRESGFRLGERLNIAVTGKRFCCAFIKPGLVSYTDVGADGFELLQKKTIDEYLNTMVGAPLIVRHVTTLKPVPVDRVCGRVDKAWYDAKSGWYFCSGTVENEQGRQAINSMKKASCGYRVPREFGDAYGPGGTEHNIPFVAEIQRIQFHHLAIVEDRPRYEGADIKLNSVKQPPAMFKFIRKYLKKAADAGGADQPAEETGELDGSTMLEVPGVGPVALKDLAQDRRNAVEAEKLAKEKGEKDDDETDTTGTITADTQVEVAPGEFATVGELVAERVNAVRKKKEADEKAETERQNSRRTGAQSFRVLAEAKQTAPTQGTELAATPGSLDEAVARGRERYGSAPAAGGRN